MITLESIKLKMLVEKEDQKKLRKKVRLPLQISSPWKILIVDDEIGIHEMTKLALNDFTFKRKNLTFLSAYSVEDAQLIIKTHPDIALMFLDVKIDKDSSGFEVINYIRKELNNELVQIVMRAGQSKFVPEDIVILNYDINDYKIKTEPTVERLSNVTYKALKTYHQKVTKQEKSLNH